MTSVSTAIHKRNSPDLALQLLGKSPIDISIINSYEEYQKIFSIRHDLIHSIICDQYGFPFGERSLKEIKEEHKLMFIDDEHYTKVQNLTPDIFEYKDGMFYIKELTITTSMDADRKKYSKYSLLVYFLRKNGFKISLFEVIVVDPLNVESSLSTLEKPINQANLDLITLICANSLEINKRIRSEHGDEWHIQFSNIRVTEDQIGVQISDVLEEDDFSINHVTHSREDLMDLLDTGRRTHPKQEIIDETNKHKRPKLNQSDNLFIKHCVNLASKMETTLTKTEKFDEENFIKKLNERSTTSDLHSIFPIPFIRGVVIDASRRSTEYDYQQNSIMAALMKDSTDAILRTIGEQYTEDFKAMESGACKIKLSFEDKSLIAEQGPGRKHFIRMGSPAHIAAHNKKRNLSLDYHTDVQSIDQLLVYLSMRDFELEETDMMTNAKQLSNLSGPGLNMIRVAQSIFREVNINALRSERRKCFILKPTGVRGVSVLLHRGAKLRTGELVSQIWFKILMDSEHKIDDDAPCSWAFKRFYNAGVVWQSNWLSTDAHRLDHYLRCYDKVIMSYYAVMNQRFKLDKDSSSISRSIIKDDTNCLGLILLTYMEDKRSTSKTLQHLRYLVMTSVSLFKYYNSVMDKMVEQVRSPLQLYIIKKSVEFIHNMEKRKISDLYLCGSVSFDVTTGTFQDAKAGAVIKFPSALLQKMGNNYEVEFSELLSEMYFTQLFNKNQDDPTHASFQILKKMLEGEKSMEDIKKGGLHLGYHPKKSDEEVASILVKERHPNQFSRRAMEIGSILRFENSTNTDEGDYVIAAKKPNLNKTIDNFATFKSSAKVERLTFNHQEIRQNSRTKCIDAVSDLLKMNMKKTYDVIREYMHDITTYHIFKKNQIGGVREILILTIQKRIMINALETYSRNICMLDPREMLTHGAQKLENLRSSIHDSRKLEGRRMTINLNFDKSKWGPSFMPCQFIYLFSRFKHMIPDMYYFIVLLMLQHHNKRCVYPERLLMAWIKDPENIMKHDYDENLQRKKEKFLENKQLYFTNESNMGQGILHYTSSLLHLCLLSFRDKIYSALCEKEGIYPEESTTDHKDLVSSDDSYTALSVRISNVLKVRFKLELFLRATEVSERLFNCWTSKAKSSISLLLGEFNSVFLSNMTFFPTLIKFAMASVHPVNTDSFYTMVKESYIASRQIFENGGSLELYMVSQMCNKRYCEEIYHTYPGGHNDLTKLGIKHPPFQVGHFPIFEPSLMISFGPEYYNYKIFKNFERLNDNEQKLFVNSHKIIRGGIVESMAQFEEGDTILGGLLRIEAKVGPMKQLGRLKSNSVISYDEMETMIMSNPLLVIKRPETLEEVRFKTALKLWQRSAAEAVRIVSASIYYGRMAASVSANAFHIPNGGIELGTYSECLQQLLHEESDKITDFRRNFKFLYPRFDEYELFVQEPRSIAVSVRDPMEIQTIRKLELHKVHTRLTYTLFEILDFFWNDVKPEKFQERRMDRDWAILTEYYPLMDTSMEVTMENFVGDEFQKKKQLIMLILKLFSLRDRSIKTICYGPSTKDIRVTVDSMITNNTYSGLTMSVYQESQKTYYQQYDYDRLYWLHNYTILALYLSKKVDLINTWKVITKKDGGTELFDYLIQDPQLNLNIKKRILMLALSVNMITNIETWTEKTDTILHFWLQSQKFNPKTNTWSGSYKVIAIKGDTRMMISYNEHTQIHKIQVNDPQNNYLMYLMLSHLTEIVGSKPEDFVNKVVVGNWMINSDRIIPTDQFGFFIEINSLTQFEIPYKFHTKVEDEWTTLMDESNHKIYRVSTGLLNTTRYPKPDEYKDFDVFGVSMSKMSSLGCFTHGFEPIYKSKADTLSVLDDLKIERLPVSDITKQRLNLSDNWLTYDREREEKLELSNISVIQEVTIDKDPIESFLEMTDEQFEDIKTTIDFEQDDSYLRDFIDKFKLTDLFNTYQTANKIMRTRLNWNRIKRIKSLLIAHQCLTEMRVNKQSIMQVYNSTKNRSLLDALVMYYDMIYTNSSTESPKDLSINLSGEFLRKFNISIEDEIPF
jgi:hypothetical protein